MTSFSDVCPSLFSTRWRQLFTTACIVLLLLGPGRVSGSYAQEAPSLRPVAESPQTSGTAFWVDLTVGTEANPVDNLLGTSFVLEYDASRAVVVSDSAGAFLGSEVVYQSSVDNESGEVGIGISRTDSSGTDGHGVVARVKVLIPDTTEGDVSLPFAVSEVTATRPNGDLIQLSSGESTVDVVSPPPVRAVAPASIPAGSSFWVDLTVGTDSIPVDQLFGTSMSFSFDPERLSVVADSAGSFLGADVVYQSNIDSAAGEIGIGVSRKAGDGAVSGHGKVARVKLHAAEGAGGTSVPLEVPAVSATDPEGNSVHLDPKSRTVEIEIPAEDRVRLRPAAAARAGAKEEFWVDVQAGTEATPADNLFGTSLTLDYDAQRVSVVNDEAGDFLGSDVVYQSNVDSTAGEIGIGVTRKSGAGGVSGTGTVARVRVSVADTVSEGTSFSFQVKEASANRPNGEGYPTRTEPLTVSVPTVESVLVEGNGTSSFGDTGGAIDFSGVSGEDTVTVERFNDQPVDTSGISEENVSNSRLFITTGSALSFGSAEIRLAVDQIAGITADPGQVVLYRRAGAGTGSFERLETSVDDNDTPEIVDDTLLATTDSFSEFVLASDSEPLPVELAGFDATTVGDKVRLTWQTVSETENARFEVQRRRKRRSGWTVVGTVDGAGTTTKAQSYRFTDASLPYEAGQLAYRLRQVDVDGTASLSETVTVGRSVKTAELLGTYPNPATQQVTVRYAVPERMEVAVRLYDMLGRQIRTLVDSEQTGRHKHSLDVSNLSSGVYFLRLQSGGHTRTQRLTIVR
jgi:hypothetical protein